MAAGRRILIRYESWVVELVDADSGKSICKINEPVPPLSGMLRTWPIDPLGHLLQRDFRVRPLTEDERREFGIADDASK
jgi:hypothetical protein